MSNYNSSSSAIAAAALICALALAMAHSAVGVPNFLTAHNRARNQAGVRPVGWDLRLEQEAMGDASYCMYSSSPTSTTENHLWLMGSGVFHEADAVAVWVREKAYYNSASGACSAPRPSETCDHYLRVVDPLTNSIGCARRICRTPRGEPVYYFICKYAP